MIESGDKREGVRLALLSAPPSNPSFCRYVYGWGQHSLLGSDHRNDVLQVAGGDRRRRRKGGALSRKYGPPSLFAEKMFSFARERIIIIHFGRGPNGGMINLVEHWRE